MKLKKSSADAAEAAGGAFISERLRNPADELAAQKPASSDKIWGLLAIIATVMLAAIAVMLYMNFNLIKSA